MRSLTNRPTPGPSPRAGHRQRKDSGTARKDNGLSVSEGLYRRERVRVGKVSIATKVFQAVGALPEALKNFAFGTFLLFYYNQVLHVDAFKASTAIALALMKRKYAPRATLSSSSDSAFGSYGTPYVVPRLIRR